MEKGAGQGSPQSKSEVIMSSREDSGSELELQARRLSQLYFFCHETARTVASLAWGVSR